MDSLMKKIMEKDMVTYKHSLRVAALCHDFCIHLGKSKEYAEEMRVAGLLHDVGKIDIPDEILCKAGALTKDEHSVMEKHTELSAKYLAGYSELIRNVAYGHHLAYEGEKGYPNVTISGEDIPEESRITAVCDVYEALTAERQYKEALSQTEAYKIMEGMDNLDKSLFMSFKKFMKGAE